MRILIVCSQNSGKISPFIVDQVDALIRAGIVCDYYTIRSKGVIGYLKSRKGLLLKIESFLPQIIHAHYGLSGFLANLQRSIPVITTYHGSDINNSKIFPFSKLCMQLSGYNIFVSQKNLNKSKLKKRFSLIPCGVDIETFRPMDKTFARQQMSLDSKEKLVLFAGDFNNAVKNYDLAIAGVKQLIGVKLIELKGFSRQQVAMLMNAVDVCLLTSHSEGSPQFIKEAMACNCPIVTVDVGDVKEVVKDVEGCFVCSKSIDDVSRNLEMAFKFNGRTTGRHKILSSGLDQDSTILKLKMVYQQFSK